MQHRLFLFLGLFAALASVTFAQNTNTIASTAVRIGGGSDISDFERPRIVEERAAAVKGVVIVNTVNVERIAFEMLNQKRVEKGLSALAWNEDLAGVARGHSQNMAEFQFFSHRGLDNKMVSDRADDRGIKKWRAIGENIAYNRGYGDPTEKAVQQWLNSPAHLHNLMDGNWKESALGVAVASDGSYYFTQVFLKK